MNPCSSFSDQLNENSACRRSDRIRTKQLTQFKSFIKEYNQAPDKETCWKAIRKVFDFLLTYQDLWKFNSKFYYILCLKIEELKSRIPDKLESITDPTKQKLLSDIHTAVTKLERVMAHTRIQ